MRRRLLVVGVASAMIGGVATMLIATRASTDDPVRVELARFAGTWQMVVGENDRGGKAAENYVRKHRFIITHDGRFTTLSGDKVISEGVFTLYPSKLPKAVDFNSKAGALAGSTLPRIYDLNGDDLSFASVL